MKKSYSDYVQVLKKVRLLLDNKSIVFFSGLCSFVYKHPDLSPLEQDLFNEIIYKNPTQFYFQNHFAYFFEYGNIIVRKAYLTKLIHKYERM